MFNKSYSQKSVLYFHNPMMQSGGHFDIQDGHHRTASLPITLYSNTLEVTLFVF